jgi:hypothetical protein
MALPFYAPSTRITRRLVFSRLSCASDTHMTIASSASRIQTWRCCG